MKRLALAALLILGLAVSVQAQSYHFAIPEAVVTVTIKEDGSATIHYQLTFRCQPGAHPIDVVDIGMPNMSSHSPGSAAVDGQAIPSSSVRISTYLKPRGSGYEVQLGQHTIQPGHTGVFEFTARESNMVWQDTTDPEQASFRFTPTWFGSQYVTGTTKLTLRYRLPIPESEYAAVKDRILWQKEGQDFDVKGVMEGEDVASVAWVDTVSLTGPHEYGVSFPKRFVTNVRKDSIFAIFLRWFEGNPEVQFYSGGAAIILFSIVFFMLTRGTGFTVFILVAVGLGYGMYRSTAFHLWLYPGMLAFALLVYWLRQRRKRRYFPAELCREGGGLKRGLTAVEAAVLLEIPLNKILTMIIFGLAKKGLLEIREVDPLRVEVVGTFRSPRVWKRPDRKDVKIRPYEGTFLRAFRDQRSKPVEDMKLDDAFDALIDRVVNVMEGFDFKATRDYYRTIVTRAWAMVEKEGGYEARYQRLDKHFDWLMIDDSWNRRLNDSTVGRPYVPHWWYGHGHTHSHGPVFGGGGGGSLPSSGRTAPTTSFGDVASSIVGRFEGVSARVAGSLDAMSSAQGGLDLSGVDRFTGEILKGLAESGGSGGGGGGGGFSCACACAGCACACACAGGGR